MDPHPEDFEHLLSQYTKIKKRYVDRRLKFYQDRVNGKRRAAQGASIAILFLSLAIPIVANSDFMAVPIAVSAMSLAIAFISGVSELRRWQHTWKEYSQGIVQIETLIGSWEIKVAEARQLSRPEEISAALGTATEELLRLVTQAVSAEMEDFFRPAPKAPPTQPGEK